MEYHDGSSALARTTEMATIGANEQPLTLECMPQRSGLLGAEDDWTGLTNSIARRRVQNRINQRAYRKRKRLDVNQRTSRVSRKSNSLPQDTQSSSSVSSQRSSSSTAFETQLGERRSLGNELWMLFNSAADRSQLDRQKLSRVATICNLGPLEQRDLISEFERWVEHCQRLGFPRSDHLLVLVKFNVLRAVLSNGADLGYIAEEGAYSEGARSQFSNPDKTWRVKSMPAALRPTTLQRQIPHHPWIDILPSPVMRDNLILAEGSYDVMELCADLVGFFSADKGRTGMIVWREPWDIAGWEVTASFVKHWGWTIRGCDDLSRSTDYWRERRGERPLKIEQILCEERSGDLDLVRVDTLQALCRA